MPLFNNILSSRRIEPKNQETTAKINPNASLKLLQDHLLSKQRSKQQQNVLKKPIQKAHDVKSSSQIISESNIHKSIENDWSQEEEYDPLVPNSYEILQAEFLKSEEIKLASRSPTTSGKKIMPNILDVLDKLESDQDYIDDGTNIKRIKGTTIAPPPSLTTSSSFNPDYNQDKPDIGPCKPLKTSYSSSGDTKLDGGSIAAKIMSKMGYKQGSGLGKDEQGISSPLEVEKSGMNAGRILIASRSIHKSSSDSSSEVVKNQVQCFKEEIQPKTKEGLQDVTRVLLLQNMVGPGEVDNDLEAETKEECKKYGDVVKCLIYEIPNKKVPDSEAVRIFVEFRHEESASKAVNDLNGRYFGGRIVKASFYSVDRFNKYELGPQLNN